MPDWKTIRADFPVLHQQVNGKPLVYLDNAATAQKPRSVIEALVNYYERDNSNVHRGLHALSMRATNAYEGARARVAQFINAADPAEIIFTRGTTESINIVARSWSHAHLKPGDVVLTTEIEHHSNLVPWQQAAKASGATLKYVPVLGENAEGGLDLAALDQLLTKDVKLFAFTHISNSLGTINPAKELCRKARAVGAITVIDAAQSIGHMPVDVQDLDCDFLAFSGHKMCGPTGIGVLYGREDLLEAMPPFLGGGEMIRDVRLDGFTTNDLPWKFEAGTPAIAEIIGLGAAVEWLNGVGMDNIRAHEISLTEYTMSTLHQRFGDRINIHGPTSPLERGGVFSFDFDGLHPHDISQVLDQHAVCVRAGHHCAKPLMKLLGIGATARASVYVYNDTADIDALADALDATGAFFTL